MKRQEKAILNSMKRLIDKYGFNKTRLVINRYFALQREKKNTEKIVREKEQEINRLKARLDG